MLVKQYNKKLICLTATPNISDLRPFGDFLTE